MMVIPIKWLPWLLVFVGIGGLITGEDLALCIGCGVVGGLWLYAKYRPRLAKPQLRAQPVDNRAKG